MIRRLWRGWPAGGDADAYEQFLLTGLLWRYDERALHFDPASFHA